MILENTLSIYSSTIIICITLQTHSAYYVSVIIIVCSSYNIGRVEGCVSLWKCGPTHARTFNYINGTTRTICAAICTNRSHTSRNRFDRIIRKRHANTTDNTLTIWWIQYSLQEDTSHSYRGPFTHTLPPLLSLTSSFVFGSPAACPPSV